jgi:hypothetical protein
MQHKLLRVGRIAKLVPDEVLLQLLLPFPLGNSRGAVEDSPRRAVVHRCPRGRR